MADYIYKGTTQIKNYIEDSGSQISHCWGTGLQIQKVDKQEDLSGQIGIGGIDVNLRLSVYI